MLQAPRKRDPCAKRRACSWSSEGPSSSSLAKGRTSERAPWVRGFFDTLSNRKTTMSLTGKRLLNRKNSLIDFLLRRNNVFVLLSSFLFLGGLLDTQPRMRQMGSGHTQHQLGWRTADGDWDIPVMQLAQAQWIGPNKTVIVLFVTHKTMAVCPSTSNKQEVLFPSSLGHWARSSQIQFGSMSMCLWVLQAAP